MERKIIIGSRGSDLALWQADFTQKKLAEEGIESEIKIISTTGDQIQNLSFDKMEGKGFFTKEIEEALLKKEIDLAVHSHKDLETSQPEGLTIAAVSYREDPSDMILVRKESADTKRKYGFKKGAVIGTSSARRKTQLLSFRPDVKIKDLRGNVPTRIQKLRDGDYDAIMLATAGVERLELDVSDFYIEKLDPKEFIPAPAQGVLALQIREEDTELAKALKSYNNKEVQRCISVERKILNMFEGGCQMPLGSYCEYDDSEDCFNVWTMKADEWDSMPQRIFQSARRHGELAEYVVHRFENSSPKKVFITRDLSEDSYFSRSLSALGYEVNGKALIEIKPMEFTEFEKTEWIFFSSKNAVKYFFDQNPDIGDSKIAAISTGTAAEVRKYGYRCGFIGASTDTKMVGKQFSALAGRNGVLFPKALSSLRNVQNCLPEGKVKEVVVYCTVKNEVEELPDAEIYAFTSPSNVATFFANNELTKGALVMSMGNATANTLSRYGVDDPIQPQSFSEVGLAEAVCGA